MIGLGVGIDYACSSSRATERASTTAGRQERSTVVAIDTAGRAVLFAGTTVIISLLGMFLMGLSVRPRAGGRRVGDGRS